uniref:MARVEL domain-containing protein n=1 Tax=Ascaris lumbricoides TaxID=6252 RepID=A0A0M3I0U6_ASCLU
MTILFKRVAGCSLLNIPEGKWRTFTRLVYVHFGVATLLFMFGIICFCVGMQYSGMYSEVNCADGTNIWIPLLNLIVSFSGLFALRTLHLHWPAFIHCLGLWLMLLMMLAPIVDSALASSRWFDRAKRPLDSWATNFSWIDLTLSLIACINGFYFPLAYFIVSHT